MDLYPIRAAKTAAVAAVAALAGWKAFEALYAWADHAADEQTSSGAANDAWAGFYHYIAAGLAGIVLMPLAVWAGLRLVRMRGNHLAVIVSGCVWFAVVAPHLVDRSPTAWEAVLWVSVQTFATAVASVMQAVAFPESTQRKSPVP
ncbi:hypothetical protein [Streptomyces sp. HC307]|uniref:hypothetical protein n=1 Tax=Streptomyces flavusporus TaxID=3385496 RepID=UPI003916DA00